MVIVKICSSWGKKLPSQSQNSEMNSGRSSKDIQLPCERHQIVITSHTVVEKFVEIQNLFMFDIKK